MPKLKINILNIGRLGYQGQNIILENGSLVIHMQRTDT